MKKRLILVSAPPGCGKTFISKQIAAHLHNVVFLDKDALVPLSNVSYKIAHEPIDREGPFFKTYIRDVEYEVIMKMAFDALGSADKVLINAPFTKEVRDKAYMSELRKTLKEKFNASLTVVWVVCSIETAHRRMIERNSSRDVAKLANWDEYIKTQNYSIPEHLMQDDDPKSLIIFNNEDDEEYKKSLKKTIRLLKK